jgi:isomerase DpgB
MTSTDTSNWAQVWIDGTRPLSRELVATVSAFSDEVEDAHGLAVLHLSGAPAGGRSTGDLDVHLVNKWERALRRLERLKVATVAVAEGDCGGIALETLLCTDYRLATQDVRLLVPIEPGHGASWPGMVLYRMANQAGVARTRRSVLFGVPVTAADAADLGLVDEVVADRDAAMEAVDRLPGLAHGAELAIRRQLMFEATTTTFEDALGTHLAACDRALRLVRNGEPS